MDDSSSRQPSSLCLCCTEQQLVLYVFQVLNMVKDVTPLISAPIILFIYFNPIKARGPEKLCQQAKAAGVSGKLHRPRKVCLRQQP